MLFCQAITNAANTLYATKRLIGRKFSDESTKKEATMVPFKIVRCLNFLRFSPWDVLFIRIHPQRPQRRCMD